MDEAVQLEGLKSSAWVLTTSGMVAAGTYASYWPGILLAIQARCEWNQYRYMCKQVRPILSSACSIIGIEVQLHLPLYNELGAWYRSQSLYLHAHKIPVPGLPVFLVPPAGSEKQPSLFRVLIPCFAYNRLMGYQRLIPWWSNSSTGGETWIRWICTFRTGLVDGAEIDVLDGSCPLANWSWLR